jgi:hypothetical protein
MRVLFATGSPAHYMRPPLLGDQQIVCGPDWTDALDSDGRPVSLNTPAGEYDLSAVAQRLDKGDQPDVVVALVDAGCRNLPRNLQAFRCPRVLLVADTHHMPTPLSTLLSYAASEPFDRIVLLYDRHHFEFFRSMGLRNLHWFPGLTFPHGDAMVASARNPRRHVSLAFVGQVGKFHPRRTRVLEALTAAGLPLDRQMLPQNAALAHYGSALIGVNASLNGDLNLRVFEVLSTGGALLTDRLATSSGLNDLLREGREMITYGSEAELVERASHAIAHPTETFAIGQAGAAWFDAHFSEALRKAAFQALAVDGTQPAAFPLPPAGTSVFLPAHPLIAQRAIAVYELVQDVHRVEETVRVGLCPASQGFRAVFETLPRVQIVDSSQAADLRVTSAATLLSSETAPAIWCWDAPADDLEAIALTLDGGYLVASAEVGFLEKSQPPAESATAPAA